MDWVIKLREDTELADLFSRICDVMILPEFVSPEDEGGHLTYNIAGKTFAKRKNGSEFILLEDGSVGFWGSEGESGRIADSLTEFFSLMVNCPYWRDCVISGPYQDRELLDEFAEELYEEHKEMFWEELNIELYQAQKELADKLGIVLEEDVLDLLLRFYDSANREPRFFSTYREEDGSIHSNKGTLFQ